MKAKAFAVFLTLVFALNFASMGLSQINFTPISNPDIDLDNDFVEKGLFGIKTSKGWNLISFPATPVLSDYAKEHLTFYQLNMATGEQVFVEEPQAGQAYWVFNDLKAGRGYLHVYADKSEPASVNDVGSLQAGWNFVAVTPDMIGKDLSNMGSCSVSATITFLKSEWSQAFTNFPINPVLDASSLGKGLLVLSDSECSLTESSE